jgi:PHD finger protein
MCCSKQDEDALLLCERCNSGTHFFCTVPPLDAVPGPDVPWFCSKSCSKHEKLWTTRLVRALTPLIRPSAFPDGSFPVMTSLERVFRHPQLNHLILRGIPDFIAEEKRMVGLPNGMTLSFVSRELTDPDFEPAAGPVLLLVRWIRDVRIVGLGGEVVEAAPWGLECIYVQSDEVPDELNGEWEVDTQVYMYLGVNSGGVGIHLLGSFQQPLINPVDLH